MGDAASTLQADAGSMARRYGIAVVGNRVAGDPYGCASPSAPRFAMTKFRPTTLPAQVAQFMVDTSVLAELTAGACAAVTGRQDATALLRAIDSAHLFLVALDDQRMTFRYHPSGARGAARRVACQGLETGAGP